MDKAKLNAIIFAVLGALKEAEHSVTSTMGGIPNGHCYAQLMSMVDIDQWNKIISLLIDSGLITQTNYLLKITPKGVELFVKMENIIKAHS